MSNSNEKYLGESPLKGGTNKKLTLKLKEESVNKTHLSQDLQHEVDRIDDLQNQIDSIQIGGWAISQEFGSDEHIGISQKALTEFRDEKIQKDTEQDETLGEHTAELADYETELDNIYRKSETYNKEELNNMITTPNQKYKSYTAEDGDALSDILPATGEADTIYRVGNWDGAYSEGCYSEYAWAGAETGYVLLSKKEPGIDDEPTAGSDNLVKSGGVYSLVAGMGVSNNLTFNSYVAEIYVASGTVITQIDFAVASLVSSGQHTGEYLNLFRLRTASNSNYHSFFPATYYETQGAALAAWNSAFPEMINFDVQHSFGVAFTGKPFASITQIAAIPTANLSDISVMPILKGYLLPNDGEGITDNVEVNRYVKELVVTKELKTSTVKLKVGILTGFLSSSKYFNIIRIYEYDSSDNSTSFDVYKESYDTLADALSNMPKGIYEGENGKVLFGESHDEFYVTGLSINHPLTIDYAPILKSLVTDSEIEKLKTGNLIDEDLEDIPAEGSKKFKSVTIDDCVAGEVYKIDISLTVPEGALDGADDDSIVSKVYVRYYPNGTTKTLETTTITKGSLVASLAVQPSETLPHTVIISNNTDNIIVEEDPCATPFDAHVTVSKRSVPVGVSAPFKILYIGSSLGLQSVLYTPPILLNMGITNYTIGYAFKGGCELEETLAALNGDTSIKYEYNKWTAGAVAWDTTKVPEDELPASGLNDILNILQDEEWDCIVISQAADKIYGSYDTYFAPYIQGVCQKLYELVDHPVKLGWNALASGYINLASDFQTQTALLQTRWESIIANTQRVVSETPVEFVIASGTSIQNARHTSLNDCGFYGHLVGDSVHFNDGLPRMLAGYYTAIKWLDLMGDSKRSVLGDKLVFDDKSFINRYNTGHMTRGTSGVEGYMGREYPWYDPVDSTSRYVAQLCAIAAVKKPFEITTVVEPED